MKSLKSTAIAFGFVALLTGCGADNDNKTAMDTRPYNEPNDNVNVQNVRYNPNNVNNNINDNDTDLTLADEVADNVTDLKGVDSAVVMKTDRNAFVAVTLDGNKEGNVTDEMEEKIANKVRETDKDVENVYVSSNPDFYHRMTNYGNDLENVHPVRGMFDEFSETVRRVFPNYR